MKKSNLFSLLLSLSSCSYQWQPVERPAICVPFIQGDDDGTFTVEVMQSLASSGIKVSANAHHRLEITLKGQTHENIGYRRDPQKVDGKVRKNLLAVEGRKTLSLEMALYQGEEKVFGPYLIEADVDYDYVDGDSLQDLTFTNSAGELVTVLPFSLGQLESIESAQEAANKPLYTRLAQKIVDAILSKW